MQPRGSNAMTQHQARVQKTGLRLAMCILTLMFDLTISLSSVLQIDVVISSGSVGDHQLPSILLSDAEVMMVCFPKHRKTSLMVSGRVHEHKCAGKAYLNAVVGFGNALV